MSSTSVDTGANPERRFLLTDQQWFARVSGDANPLHLDPVWARRTLVGELAVHGIHVLLWALEEYCRTAGVPNIHIRVLNVRFLEFVPVGRSVRLAIEDDVPGRVTLRVVEEQRALMVAQLDVESMAAGGTSRTLTRSLVLSDVARRGFGELSGLSGVFMLGADEVSAQRRFGSCFEKLGPDYVTCLLSLSRFVGMECPGAHALFVAFELSIDSREAIEPMVDWRVVRASRPLVEMRLENQTAHCAIRSFYVRHGEHQATMEDVLDEVEPEEFLGQVPLVVGGSRGLGEITAKLLAAGGAVPIVSWSSGQTDAERVCAEIRRAGMQAEAMRLDVLDPAQIRQTVLRCARSPNCLYYFASPRISPRQRVRTYEEFYVTGFERVCRAFATHGPLGVFYPSSVFVERPPPGAAPYASVKLRGEDVCRRLGEKGICRPFCPRLPKMATDQNLSLFGGAGDSPTSILLPQLRRFHRDVMRDIHGQSTELIRDQGDVAGRS